MDEGAYLRALGETRRAEKGEIERKSPGKAPWGGKFPLQKNQKGIVK